MPNIPTDLLKSTLPDPLTKEHKEFLKGLQGNILKGHGRKYSAALFVVLPDETPGLQVIGWLAGEVTSAEAQLTATKNRKQAQADKVPYEETKFQILGLSGQCYERFGLPYPVSPQENPQQERSSQEESRKPRKVDPAEESSFRAFRNGMKAGHEGGYAAWSPDTSTWELKLGADFDLLLLIAHDQPGELKTAIKDATKGLTDRGVKPKSIVVEEGRSSASAADLDETKEQPPPAIEHFGYVDGIAKPAFFQKDVENRDHHQNKATLGDVVCLEDKDRQTYGSFLSVLKLEQNVSAFQDRAREMQAALRLEKGEGEEEFDKAAALAVGRRKDGTPLVRRLDGQDFPPNEDDFNYNGDPVVVGQGAKQCPASAHIRKMNPRLKNTKAVIARRGFHYGPAWMDGNLRKAPPKEGVGLMFLGFTSSLRTFVGLMGPTESPRSPARGGVDSLIGRSQEAPLKRPGFDGRQRWWGEQDRNWVDFKMADFVTLRGGEYFFVPSTTFLNDVKEKFLPKTQDETDDVLAGVKKKEALAANGRKNFLRRVGNKLSEKHVGDELSEKAELSEGLDSLAIDRSQASVDPKDGLG